MSPTERKALINADRTDLSLTKQCKLLKISRSLLYYTPVGVNAETLELMNEIDRVFTKYPFFGSRQIAAYLPRNGFYAGRYRVRRLMGIMPCPARASQSDVPRGCYRESTVKCGAIMQPFRFRTKVSTPDAIARTWRAGCHRELWFGFAA